jgi:hypothetical protein
MATFGGSCASRRRGARIWRCQAQRRPPAGPKPVSSRLKPGDQTPCLRRSRVAGSRPVVTFDEGVADTRADPRMTLGVATVGLDVRLVELLAVEAVVAVSFRPRLAGKGDDPLDEDAARPLRLSCEICTYSGFVLAAGTERLGQEALSAAVGKAGRSLAPCLVCATAKRDRGRQHHQTLVTRRARGHVKTVDGRMAGVGKRRRWAAVPIRTFDDRPDAWMVATTTGTSRPDQADRPWTS